MRNDIKTQATDALLSGKQVFHSYSHIYSICSQYIKSHVNDFICICYTVKTKHIHEN